MSATTMTLSSIDLCPREGWHRENPHVIRRGHGIHALPYQAIIATVNLYIDGSVPTIRSQDRAKLRQLGRVASARGVLGVPGFGSNIIYRDRGHKRWAHFLAFCHLRSVQGIVKQLFGVNDTTNCDEDT